jgi:hypothetical protein
MSNGGMTVIAVICWNINAVTDIWAYLFTPKVAMPNISTQPKTNEMVRGTDHLRPFVHSRIAPCRYQPHNTTAVSVTIGDAPAGSNRNHSEKKGRNMSVDTRAPWLVVAV